jgi:hypothetical protein
MQTIGFLETAPDDGEADLLVANGSLRVVNGKRDLVTWFKHEVPADFLWEFTVRRDRRKGLVAVYFSARGLKGEGIFDPSLPPRNGAIMADYHSGAIENYWVSFYGPRRGGESRLRKNVGERLVARGRDLVMKGWKGRFQRVSVYKRKGLNEFKS